MTLNEFRAWLDGFKEAVGEAPTPEQWAKVIERLAQVYELPPQMPLAPASVPNVIGPYWSPSIPTTVPRFPWGEVTCRNDTEITCGTRAYVNGQDVGPSD